MQHVPRRILSRLEVREWRKKVSLFVILFAKRILFWSCQYAYDYVYWKKELCLWRVLQESVVSPDTHKTLVYFDWRFGQPSASFSEGYPPAINDGKPKHTHCEDTDWIPKRGPISGYSNDWVPSATTTTFTTEWILNSKYFHSRELVVDLVT